MDLKRCENNHYYDASKFDSCPHCQQGVAQEVSVAFDQAGGTFGGPAVHLGQEPLTVPQGGAGMAGGISQTDTLPDPIVAPKPSLTEAVSQANTMPYEDESKTIGIYTPTLGKEPVVGWLVCIEGSYFGESFQLKTGRNFIGRSQSMDVVLANDNSVSRDKHAIILYEPKRREFIAQAGESRELFYLNGEVVLNAARMKAQDIFSIGKTKLMFFPCCGENFGWDDFSKEEEEK